MFSYVIFSNSLLKHRFKRSDRPQGMVLRSDQNNESDSLGNSQQISRPGIESILSM